MMKHQQYFRGLICAHSLHWDDETRSVLDLKKVGVHVYAAHSSTQIICVSYAVDGNPVKTWLPGDPVPDEFIEAAANPSWTMCAHNSPFETTIAQNILYPRHGFPPVPPERHRCTLAMSLALGLPAKLKTLADVLEQEHRKDMAGERLMHQMSKPRKHRRHEDPAGLYWHDEPDKLQRLVVYNKKDVECEREADNRLMQLSDSEQALWLLSNEINARGFHVDRQFAEAARKIAGEAMPEINGELAEVTGGAVTSVHQRDKLKAWLQSVGCTPDTLERDVIEELLEGEGLSPPARRALELRLAGSQAAVKKIDALLARAGCDDRVRGAFTYHGASTGRWSGVGFQPQNLKRPETEDIGAAIAAVATGDYAHMKSLYAKPLSVVGDCSRSTITARDLYRLIGGDFGAIESRVLAWIADEIWKLDAYRKFDETGDPRLEPYCVTAAKILRVPEGSVTKETPRERKIGKTCDLSFGYMGALGAWRNFEPDQFSDAEVEVFKIEWRAAHPKTKQFWYDIDRAAITAVRKRGEAVHCGMFALQCDGMSLRIWLPSGRALSYPFPQIIKDDRGNSRVLFSDNADGQFRGCNKGKGAYGGIWTENIVSGISRDLLVEAMRRVEAAGYPIVLHVHDELTCEVPLDFGSEQEFAELVTRNPSWAPDLPIAAETWSGPRYVK